MTLIGLEYLKHQETARGNRAKEELDHRKIESSETIAKADRESREGIAAQDRTSREAIAKADRESKEGIASLDRESKEGIESGKLRLGYDQLFLQTQNSIWDKIFGKTTVSDMVLGAGVQWPGDTNGKGGGGGTFVPVPAPSLPDVPTAQDDEEDPNVAPNPVPKPEPVFTESGYVPTTSQKPTAANSKMGWVLGLGGGIGIGFGSNPAYGGMGSRDMPGGGDLGFSYDALYFE